MGRKFRGNRRQSSRQRDKYQLQARIHARFRARQRAQLSAGEITEAIKEKQAEWIGYGQWGRRLYRISQGSRLPFVYAVWCVKNWQLVTVLTYRMVRSGKGVEVFDGVILEKFPDGQGDKLE